MLVLISWSGKYDMHTGAPAKFLAKLNRDRARVLRQFRAELSGEYEL